MAPGLILSFLLFLLLVAQAWTQGPQPLEVAGAVGGVALLAPRGAKNPSDYSEIHWRWQNRVRIARQTRGEQPRYPPSPFQGRLELLSNLSLKVSDLGRGDSGEFRLYCEDDTGRESLESVRLTVYDKVPKPHVTADTTGDPQHCNATLRCSVELQGVTYEWLPPQRSPTREGPLLTVFLSPPGDTYVCKVSNAVSSNYATLTYRPPCSWTGESSSATCATPSSLVSLGLLILLFLV